MTEPAPTAPTRKRMIVGNWKMYKTIEESVAFVKELIPYAKDCPAEVFLAVPFTAIKAAADIAKGTNVVIGAQNMNDASEGAFTGEIGARMLKNAGAKFVILGHSERRELFKETNDFINKKVKMALKEELIPILCVGESLEQREIGRAKENVGKQLAQCLAGISIGSLSDIAIAYEPIWAIGTGKIATAKEAQVMQHYCRNWLTKKDEEAPGKVSILYGGSVRTEKQVKELMEQPDIDGVLVGGASLSLESFAKIINYYKS